MQTDFHYQAVYVLARAAGLSGEAARVIATCSQYVDDAVAKDLARTADGLGIVPEVTAHRVSDLKENTDTEDQRQVWVPFHFLPGGDGDTQSERLVCQPDSPIARAAMQHAVDASRKPFGLELVGIAAHAYADTFAHWGFSGVSSRRNRVRPGSVTLSNESPEATTFFGPKLEAFLRQLDGSRGHLIPNFRAALTGAANLGSLGHAAVAISPDQPFLVWSYEYESFPDIPTRGQDRFNPLHYLQGAERLHAFFQQVAAKRPEHADPGAAQPFASIRDSVQRVLRFVGDATQRGERWARGAATGEFGPIGPIPDYAKATMEKSRASIAGWHRGDEAQREAVYRFYQAATMHRWFVLRELLPEKGIVLI